MLSRIDEYIFPNRCEVISFPLQRYVYPIFKNGSSSLRNHALTHKYKILFNSQIARIDIVDVYLRDPNKRFVSGVNTFVYNLKNEHPLLDINTILYFVENYLFLNRHYSPQLSWLINLNKYMNKSSKIRFNGIESLSDVTPLTVHPTEQMILSADAVDRLLINEHNVMYNRLDRLLLNLIGKELTFGEVLDYLRVSDADAYKKISWIALD